MKWKRRMPAALALLLILPLTACKMQANATKKLSDLDYAIVSGRELPKELYDILEEKKTESFKLTYEEDDRLVSVRGVRTAGERRLQYCRERPVFDRKCHLFRHQPYRPGAGGGKGGG